MRRLPRWFAALIAGCAVLALTACAGLPTSSGVNEGLPADAEVSAPDVALIPDRPQPGATPEQIVDGFLRAGSGAADEWARAKEFLTPSFRQEWRPQTGVTIDVLGTRVTRVLDDDTLSVLVSQVATVDEKGSYERAEEGTTPLAFELAQQADGEWRIADAPDGIVLDRNIFPEVFHSYPLAYFDQTWEHLVPDVRWFPKSRVASRIADALVNRPRSEWLAASVLTAFPEGIEAGLAVSTVAGVASVPLSDGALALDQETLDRMQTQLEESLRAAGVSSVEMVVGNTVLAAEAAPTRRTTVTGAPLVKVEQGFGFLTGDELTAIPGLSPIVAALDAVAIQVGPDREDAAVQLADGSVVRATPLRPEPIDQRPDLIAPTIDPWGAVWTVPGQSPHSVVAHLPEGRSIEVGAAWPEATHISAMTVSRDGARIAALVTVGGRTAVWVSGIVRGRDGAPSTLSVPLELGPVSGNGRGLAWLDDTTLGALSGDDETTSVLEQLVGGPGSATTGPTGAVSISGGASIATMRVRSAEGVLYIRRGSNWQETASAIVVLATQQGMPE